MEVLIAADVETAILIELSSKLPGYGWPGFTTAGGKVGTRIPGAPYPDGFIRVVAVGGFSRDLVSDSPTVVVEAFHKGEQEARDLCALSVGILEAAGRAGDLGSATTYGVSAASLPGNLPDPGVPDRFRFTATVSVTLRKLLL